MTTEWVRSFKVLQKWDEKSKNGKFDIGLLKRQTRTETETENAVFWAVVTELRSYGSIWTAALLSSKVLNVKIFGVPENFAHGACSFNFMELKYFIVCEIELSITVKKPNWLQALQLGENWFNFTREIDFLHIPIRMAKCALCGEQTPNFWLIFQMIHQNQYQRVLSIVFNWIEWQRGTRTLLRLSHSFAWSPQSQIYVRH